MDVQIFVEGITDQKFIEDYLTYIGKPQLTINECNGKGLTNVIIKKITEESKAGNKILIIFDADQNYSTSLNNIIKELPFLPKGNIFLFPNNIDIGCLETLLLKLIPIPKNDILNCFDSLITCFRGTLSAQNNKLTLPKDKTKIYTYIDIHTGENAKEKKRNYINPALWDLQNTYLDSLKTFLQSNIP